MNSLVGLFDYSALDIDTTSFLKQKERNIKSLVSETISHIGRELSEAQERLAQHGYGCFEEWYIALGFKKQSVYNYINYHKLIVQQLDNQELIESLPKALVYEAARPTTSPEIKEQILSGDIETTRQLKEAIKAQKQAEARITQLEQELSEKPEVIEKTVTLEVVPANIERELITAKVIIKERDRLATENKRLKLQIESSKDNPADDRLRMEAKVSTFTGRIKSFLREMAPLSYLGYEVTVTSIQAQHDYEQSIASLERWCSDMRDAMLRPSKEKIIDVEAM